jgi:hypothetical protein
MSSRLPAQPARDQISEDEREFYDEVVGRFTRMQPDQADGGTSAGPYRGALLNSPPLASVLSRLGNLVRTRGDHPGSYSHADREFVDQVLSADWHTAVVLGLHIPDALATGVRLEAIEALRSGNENELTDDEQLLAAYIRAVVNGTMTDELYSTMEARLGRRGTVEYTIFIAFLQLTMRLHQAFGTPEPSDDEVEALIREFRDGTRELPDFRQRIR